MKKEFYEIITTITLEKYLEVTALYDAHAAVKD